MRVAFMVKPPLYRDDLCGPTCRSLADAHSVVPNSDSARAVIERGLLQRRVSPIMKEFDHSGAIV